MWWMQNKHQKQWFYWKSWNAAHVTYNAPLKNLALSYLWCIYKITVQNGILLCGPWTWLKLLGKVCEFDVNWRVESGVLLVCLPCLFVCLSSVVCFHGYVCWCKYVNFVRILSLCIITTSEYTVVVFSVLSVCLSMISKFWKPRPRKFIYDTQVHLEILISNLSRSGQGHGHRRKSVSVYTLWKVVLLSLFLRLCFCWC